MAVTARFCVQSIVTTEFASSQQAVVKMTPDYKDGANKDWAAATPSGAIELTVKAGPALDWFRAHLAKGMHITFEDVPAAE